jgi:hypothetical protein
MSGMLCEIRTFSVWSHVSQTSASTVMSLVSSVGSQQYPARGPVFLAVGTDLGRFLTFLWSVNSMVKGALPCTATMGKETGAEMVMMVDGTEEGLGIGWECSIESIEVDKHHEMDMGQ